jgi:hypothetical protein
VHFARRRQHLRCRAVPASRPRPITYLHRAKGFLQTTALLPRPPA